MIDLGTVYPGSTVRIPFSSFDKDDGSSITMTNFAVGDILIYKDGSTTERASNAGYTATTDFDGKTGKHLAIIDLADNTTADFFAAGSEYLVAIDAVTVDAVTTGGWIARFRIGYPGAILDTTIATLASQTSFTLTAGPAEDDALNGMWAVIHDAASAVQKSWVLVSDYTGSTKTVTLAAGATFTAAAKDNISVMYPAPIQPTVLGRSLDVTATGAAGVDWANVENPTTTNDLSGTTTKAVTDAPSDSAGVTELLTRIVGTLATGTHSPQSGDAYAVAAHVTYGLAALKALIDAIKAKTDGLSFDPADASDIAAAFAAVNATLGTIAGYIDTEVSAIKAKTDNLPALPAATGDVPSAAAISAQVASDLATAHGSGSWESSGTGTGAYTRTVTVNDGSTALQGAKVRLSQGAESYMGTTNASGQVVFSVDAATWSIAITKPGYMFTPTTLVVSASGSTTYSMTASGPTPSGDPDKTTVRVTCYGADTEPEASATVQLRQLTAPNGDEGNAFAGAWTTYTADQDGLVDVTLWSDATYAIRRGTAGDVKQFTPTGATDSFTSILSR